ICLSLFILFLPASALYHFNLTFTAYPEIYLLPYTTLFRSFWKTLSLRQKLFSPDFISTFIRPVSDSLAVNPSLPCWALMSSKIRSEEHTSELQSRFDLVCRLLLEKKKQTIINIKE